MAPRSPELVFDAKAELAEGPVWHEGCLWWVNINSGTLNRLDVNGGTNVSFGTGGTLGAAVPSAHGKWLIARGCEIVLLDWEPRTMAPLATLPSRTGNQRFNDGKCDPLGRFFVGTKQCDDGKGGAGFYRYEDLELQLQFDGVTISNGLDWSPDGKRFYYTDTVTGRIDLFDYDLETGIPRNRRPLASIPSELGYPDGLCCDESGNLWVAIWGGGCVLCLDGTTGNLLDRIPLPVRRVSSCCFGGEAFDQLFITTAWEGCDDSERNQEPLAGGIFSMRPGVKGRSPTLAQI